MVVTAWLEDESFRKAWQPAPELFDAQTAFVAQVLKTSAGAICTPGHVIWELERRGELDKAGGARAIEELFEAPVTIDAWREVAELEEMRTARLLRDGLTRIANCVQAEGADYAREQIANLLQQAERSSRGEQLITVKQTLVEADRDLRDNEHPPAIKTTIHALDRATGGLVFEFVWLLGAITNWGKTAFAIALADIAIEQGYRVGFISCEDSIKLISRRLLARRARVNALHLRDRDLTAAEWSRVTQALADATDEPFLLNGRDKPAEWIASQIRSASVIEGVQLWIVDYIQVIDVAQREESRRLDVAKAGKLISHAIKNAGATGLITSQLTLKDGEIPTHNTIRDSKDLVSAADVVVLGYTEAGDKHQDSECQRILLLGKTKDGPRGYRIPVDWSSELVTFMPPRGYTQPVQEDLDIYDA